MSCGRRRPESCPAKLHLVGWAAPEGATHVVYRGYSGSYPPTVTVEDQCVGFKQGHVAGIGRPDVGVACSHTCAEPMALFVLAIYK